MARHRAPDLAAQQIASGRFARVPLRHDDTEPPSSWHGPGCVIHSLWATIWIACGQLGTTGSGDGPRRSAGAAWQVMGREVGASSLDRGGQHGFEIGRTLQAAEHWRRADASDRRQALTPFGAPGVEHGAPAARLHADEKSVRACAANLGRLVGAFHLSEPPCAAVGAARSRRKKSDQLCSSRIERRTGESSRHCVYTSACTQRFLELSGKSRIRAKTPFSVKHLHGNLRL